MINKSTGPGQTGSVSSWQESMSDSTTTPTMDDLAMASDVNSGLTTQSEVGGSAGMPEEVSSQGGDSVGQKIGSKMSDLQSSASDMTSNATGKVDQGMDRAASGMESMADDLKSRTENMGDGRMKDVADMAVDKIQSGADMMRSTSTDEMVSELETLIRRKPMESLLVAAGLGYILARKL